MVNLPNNTNRTDVVGSTGSGKTVAGCWLLSTRRTIDWKRSPAIIFDWKGDKLLNSLGAKELRIGAKPPTKPGLYICHPQIDDVEGVDQLLNRVWAQEDVGLFFDEGAELLKSKAISRIMKQGRSKHIPCITCTQQPVWLPRCVFTEADYFAVLRLNSKDDRDTLKGYVNADIHRRLPEHHILWYDVAKDRASEFTPVPSPEEIRAVFLTGKQPPKREVI